MTEREVRVRRLLAFTGVAPLGAFLVVHLVTTATALAGPARFDRVFAKDGAMAFATMLFVVLPFAFHAAYGAWVAITEPGTFARPTWWSRTRRTAALVALVFIVGHFVELPLKGYTGALRSESIFDVLTAHLSSTWNGFPIVALAYLVGLAATLFHFATSSWTFATAWSVVVTPRAQRICAWGIALAASLLFLVGANTIVYFATGKRLVGPAPALAPDGPPPAPCRPNP